MYEIEASQVNPQPTGYSYSYLGQTIQFIYRVTYMQQPTLYRTMFIFILYPLPTLPAIENEMQKHIGYAERRVYVLLLSPDLRTGRFVSTPFDTYNYCKTLPIWKLYGMFYFL